MRREVDWRGRIIDRTSGQAAPVVAEDGVVVDHVRSQGIGGVRIAIAALEHEEQLPVPLHLVVERRPGHGEARRLRLRCVSHHCGLS